MSLRGQGALMNAPHVRRAGALDLFTAARFEGSGLYPIVSQKTNAGITPISGVAP